MCSRNNASRICGLSTFLSTVIAAFIVWNSYDQGKESVRQSLETSVNLLEKSVTYALGSIYAFLEQIYVDGLRAPSSSDDGDASLQKIVTRALRVSPYLARIVVLDEHSIIRADSVSPKNIGQSFASSNYRQLACTPFSSRDRFRIGYTQLSSSFQGQNKYSQTPPHTNSTSAILVSLLEKSSISTKRRIIAEVKVSWILELLEAMLADHIENLSIWCANEQKHIIPEIFSTPRSPLKPILLSKNTTEKHQDRIFIHKKSEKYPIAILLTTTEHAIQVFWLRNNHSLVLITCLIPFGLGTFFIFLILDSKKQYSLKKEEALQSQALEQAPFACMITDTNGYVSYVNKKFSDFFGYSFDEVKGKSSNILKSNLLNNEKYKHLWKTLIAGQEWEGDLINRTKDGELKWVKAKISPLYNRFGLTTHYMCFHIDEIFYKEKHDTAAQALTQLDRNQQTSDHFLSLLCHDLAANLRSAADALLFFKSHYAAELPSTVAPHLIEVFDSIHHAQSLTDDLTMYYRPSCKMTEMGAVDLNIVLQSIKCQLGKVQPERTFSLTYSFLPTIFGQQKEIFKVFNYLIQNAAQAYFPLFSCKISVSSRRENASWRFRIASTVSGKMRHLQREMAFFHKTSFATKNSIRSETAKLSVCKKIIATYGGNLWIEREIGELEYRIFFTFPYRTGQTVTESHHARENTKDCFPEEGDAEGKMSSPDSLLSTQKHVS